MAASIHTYLPNNCKNQHQIKTVTKSPNVVRRNNVRQNTANRKSAVERLEESKANYVKSERVLDTKQEFKNASHLRISTGPPLGIPYRPPPKSEHGIRHTSSSDEVRMISTYLRMQGRDGSRSPPTMRTRTKSHSEFRTVDSEARVSRKHSFASQGCKNRIEVLMDIESQLKQLISAGLPVELPDNLIVKEPISLINAHIPAQITPKVLKTVEAPKVRRGFSDPVRRSCWSPPEVSSPESEEHCIHKSMPDLSPSPCVAPIPPRTSFSSTGSSVRLPPSRPPEPLRPPEPSRPPEPHYAVPKLLIPPPRPARRRLEKVEDEVDGFEEPQRFSNGTGVLHLTPCYSAASQLRRPVSRSKSDVSHRYSNRNSEYFPRRNNYTSAEIERFFDTMGLDTNAWHHMTTPSSVSSPPCFFESISSLDSNDDKSSNSSVDSSLMIPKDGIRNQDLKVHGPLETSIVEKNARVIKWLYNCRKAAQET